MPNPVKIRPLAAAHKLSRGLFEQLAEQIKSGRLAPGSRLPTEEALTRAAHAAGSGEKICNDEITFIDRETIQPEGVSG